jgi:hypothetical protein
MNIPAYIPSPCVVGREAVVHAIIGREGAKKWQYTGSG